MKTFTIALLAGSLLLAPLALNAQHVGLSISAVGSPSTVAHSAAAPTATTPPMPPLPRPAAAAPTVSLPSLELKLKPLNLSSNYLAPPAAFSPLRSKAGVLPALPFALDPVAARGFSQMCVDPSAHPAWR